MARPAMRFLKLRSLPIFDQLRLEERLLRTTSDNWCILNQGTLPPTIVMGASGNPGELLNVESVLRDKIPVVRRFTGGGTVIVDENTLFVTLISSKQGLPSVEHFPHPIMNWTAEFYDIAFKSVPGFSLRAQDYTIGNRKFAGNAQAIASDRWLHHTSFLWDYSPARMAYLSLPARAPAYRHGRSHDDFVCRLKDFLPSRESFQECLMAGLRDYFTVDETSLQSIDTSQDKYLHRTRFVAVSEIEESVKLVAAQAT